ncbi:hypothetical protein Ccrd_009964 [Cynara cardunculus var. scolymus]|uniref:Uncharacterized protein n=1 Tax=Cynara cardunculus var. scolymus TaxID=59895 RepID=A0A124SI55_CYNCS|nr:hypothetical protein Ccrd_009964 [Cynara cardunculus var. scolymus]
MLKGFRSRVAALRPQGPIATRFSSKNLTVVVVGESLPLRSRTKNEQEKFKKDFSSGSGSGSGSGSSFGAEKGIQFLGLLGGKQPQDQWLVRLLPKGQVILNHLLVVQHYHEVCYDYAPGVSSQLFLLVFVEDPTVFEEEATSAPETFEISAAKVAIFFLLPESVAGETLTPLDNLLPGDIDILLELGDACFRPVGEGCLYLEGTMIAGSLAAFRFSSLATTKLGTTHFEGTGDDDLFTFPAGEGSLSTTFFFPADTGLCCFIPGLENL